jgi:hypothetical protein
MATITRPNTFLQRLIGAAALDPAIYEEVEADPRAWRAASAPPGSAAGFPARRSSRSRR